MTIFLRADRDLTLRVTHPVALGQSTLRRQRTTDAWLRLAQNVMVDVGRALNVPVGAVKDILRASPDVSRYKLAGYLAVYDDAAQQVAMPPPTVAMPPLAPSAAAVPPPAPVLIEVPVLAAPLPPPAPVTPAPATIMVEEADVMPSMRWSKGRLVDYVVSRGVALDVADGMTKVELIRRIRGTR